MGADLLAFNAAAPKRNGITTTRIRLKMLTTEFHLGWARSRNNKIDSKARPTTSVGKKGRRTLSSGFAIAFGGLLFFAMGLFAKRCLVTLPHPTVGENFFRMIVIKYCLQVGDYRYFCQKGS